ncbi:MAG: zinc ribbon domain-containing protein, partial [Thermoplasmata archaeon]|nr:zinc ribbon domain-containing protein [Thermoplasmata archaeon]
MTRSLVVSWPTPGAKPRRFRPSVALGFGLLAILLLFGTPALLSHGSGPALFPAPHSGIGVPAASHATLVPSATSGDLTVASGANITIAPASGHLTYDIGGNINVLAGGHLTIKNTTVVFEQFIGNNGSVAARLGHIFHFADAGTVVLTNSSITTTVQRLDPYPSLALSVSGSFAMTTGSLAFPGGIYVNGSGANLWLDRVSITPNPQISKIAPGPNSTAAGLALYNATRYAPSIWVTNGARLSVLASTENGTFRGKPTAGEPVGIPATSAAPTATISSSSSPLQIALNLPSSTSDALALATAYDRITGGNVTFAFSQAGTAHSSDTAFLYGGTWTLPTIDFVGASGSVTVPLPSGAVNAINAGGVPAYVGALAGGQKLVQLGTTNGSAVVIHTVTVTYTAPLSYNLTVGSGSTVTAADSTFDLNWAVTPGLPSGPTYAPWNSSKIVLSGSSHAFLANISVTSALPTDYTHQSIVVPDATSTAALYRWLVLPARGAQNLPIAGAVASAYYAYAGGAFNTTANGLNALAAADPDLANYATALGASQGVVAYGQSNPNTGNINLLLVASYLQSGTLPDGEFFGDYHVGVWTSTAPTALSLWQYVTLTAYPAHTQTSGADAAAPDVTGTYFFPAFKVAATPSTPVVVVSGTVNTNGSVAQGENVTIIENLTNSGAGTITHLNVTVWFQLSATAAPVVIATSGPLGSLAVGAHKTVTFNWSVKASAVGDRPGTNKGQLNVIVQWGPGTGLANVTLPITIQPSFIAISSVPPTGALHPGQAYTMSGAVNYYGNGSAILNVSAVGPGGRYIFGETGVAPGAFSVNLFIPDTIASGTYSIDVSVSHNTRTTWENFSARFTIAAQAAPPAPVPWYQQTFLGLPVWLWIAIAAGAVVAVLGALFLLARQARGKLVECGECGQLIPETALACPKCGAAFEADLVRCSRCASTIPANSKVCPECAATLLGSAGEERTDPERQGYADFVERFRTDAKRELGDTYSEGEFWSWWKRQPSFVPFSQWQLQQSQGSRAGMTAPKEGVTAQPPRAPRPPQGGGGAAAPRAQAQRAPQATPRAPPAAPVAA